MWLDFPFDLPYDQTSLHEHLADSIEAGKISLEEYQACDTTSRWAWRGLLAGAGISVILGPLAVNRLSVSKPSSFRRLSTRLGSLVAGGGSGMVTAGLVAKRQLTHITASDDVNRIWDAFEEIKRKSRVHGASTRR